MKKLLAFAFGCAAIFLCPEHAFAWGRTGHQIVAEVAMHYVQEPVRQRVLQVLGNITPDEASVWMDEQRGDPKYDYMKPWHYIDIEKGHSYAPTNEENIINEMLIARSDLKHQQTLCSDQVRTDVLMLFHLTGDLHQPLHVGYREDKGGNTVQVNFEGKNTNLHHVWDDDLIEAEHITFDDCVKMYGTLSQQDLAQIQKVDIIAWANDSRALLDKVYDFSGHKLAEAYAHQNRELVVRQLLYGGLRLAALLDQLFQTGNTPVVSHAVAATTAPADKATPEEIAPEEAINHIGEQVTVCGKVYGGKYLDHSNGTPTFINMGAEYPNSPFTVVIFGSDRDKFKAPESTYDNKNICVTGKVKEYKGKAEIIVSETAQIKIR